MTWPRAVQTEEQAHSELVGNCLLALLGGIGVRAHPVLASCSDQDPPAAAKAAGVAQAKVNPCRCGSTYDRCTKAGPPQTVQQHCSMPQLSDCSMLCLQHIDICSTSGTSCRQVLQLAAHYIYMSTAALQAIIRRSCRPVTCWEQFAEMAVAVLRDMLDALPAGSSVSKQITEKVCIAQSVMNKSLLLLSGAVI